MNNMVFILFVAVQFFLTISVAVGGNIFQDSCTYHTRTSKKPWSSSDPTPMQHFWDDMEHWLPTWNVSKGGNAFQIDYIRVYGQEKRPKNYCPTCSNLF